MPADDRKRTDRLLTAVLVLQVLSLAGLWSDRPGVGGAAAFGQIPNAGDQRLRQLDELGALNGRMDRLLGLLESGRLQVTLKPADDEDDAEAP